MLKSTDADHIIVSTDTKLLRLVLVQSRESGSTWIGQMLEVDRNDWHVIAMEPVGGTDYYISRIGSLEPCRVLVTLALIEP